MPEKAKSAAKKPNVLVVWGDDIGIENLSCYSHAVMGYRTPNIDRLAKEGMLTQRKKGRKRREPQASELSSPALIRKVSPFRDPRLRTGSHPSSVKAGSSFGPSK